MKIDYALLLLKPLGFTGRSCTFVQVLRVSICVCVN